MNFSGTLNPATGDDSNAVVLDSDDGPTMTGVASSSRYPGVQVS